MDSETQKQIADAVYQAKKREESRNALSALFLTQLAILVLGCIFLGPANFIKSTWKAGVPVALVTIWATSRHIKEHN